MTEYFWRIAMEGDHASLADAAEFGRGEAGGATVGNIAPFVRAGRLDPTTSYVDHSALVARAAESAGFTGALLPSFPLTEDPWAFASSLIADSTDFRFMVAYQPGFLHPLQVARQSATFQRLSNGRLVFNVISGSGGPQQLWWGDRADHDSRYERTREFLDIIRGVWGGEPFDYEGRFFQTRGAALPEILRGQPFPELYFSGSSDAAIDAAGRHADYYLSWLEPRPVLERKLAQVREHAATLGQAPKVSLRVEVVARPTEAEAWRVVDRAWERARGATWSDGGDSVGAARASRATPRSSDWRDLETERNIWAGFSNLRPGPPLGIVGDYAQVAERLADLVAIGVDSFILAAPPHLEEAYRIGEEVIPLI